MSPYEEICKDIVERLGGTDIEPANFTTINVDVELTPKYAGEFRPLPSVGKSGRLSVYFDTNEFGTKQTDTTRLTLGNTAQKGEGYYIITVASRSQWGETGAINYCYLVQRLLLGFKPRYGGNLEAFMVGLHSVNEGTWYYQAVFKHNVPILALDNFLKEPLLFPGVITSICFNEAPETYGFPFTFDFNLS